jgi:hypothetical protein
MGAVVGYGSPLQGECLEGFDFLGLHHITECRLARLSRLVWDQETASSNLATPTIQHLYRLRWLDHHPFKVEDRDRHPVEIPRQFRETRARRMGLTVNQWLGGFDPHTRSHALVV